MPCRAAKLAASAPQTLQSLWITDEVLTDAFNRFLRVSYTNRRFGSNIPGPLEARRRLAKRRLGLSAVPSGSPSPAHEFGGLFRAGASRPPEFESGWKWQPPVRTRPLPLPSTKKEAEWSLPLFDGSIEESVDIEDVTAAKFLEIPGDPVETSGKAFVELLDARQFKTTLQQEDIKPIIDFLEGSANEPDARFTLRLVQWLAGRDLALGALQELVSLISQKITLRTLSEDEESAIIVSLLEQQQHVSAIVSSLIVSLTGSARGSLLSRITNSLLESAADNQHTLLARWLACSRGSVVLDGNIQSRNFEAVYEPLSRYFMPSKFAHHFHALDSEDFAELFLRHWIPKLVQLPVDVVDRDLIWSEVQAIRRSKQDDALPNDALVDLSSVLAARGLLNSTVLQELFAFWQGTELPAGILDLIKQSQYTKFPIELSTSLAASLIHSSTKAGDLRTAYHIFRLYPKVSLTQCTDLPIELIKQGQVNSNKIWILFDRRAVEACGEPNERHVHRSPLPQDLVSAVQEAAYAWARSPHLRARVAYRRVWECYRFLQENGSPLSRLMSRALARAGIVNFVKLRMPVPKTRVRHIVELIGKIEGAAVKKEVDGLVFQYWMATRNLTEYKPSGRAWREKFRGEQTLEDGSVRRVTWRHRVLREAVEMRRGAGEEVTVVDEAVVAGRGQMVEGIDHITDEGSRFGTSVESYRPFFEDKEIIDPVVGVYEAKEVCGNGIVATAPVELPPETLNSEYSRNSTYEVEELVELAREQTGVQHTDQYAEDWPSATVFSSSVDQGPSVAYRPYDDGKVDACIDSPDTNADVLPLEQFHALSMAPSTTYTPPQEPDLPQEGEAVVGEQTIDEQLPSAMDMFRAADEFDSSTVFTNDGYVSKDLPGIIGSFSNPNFRRLFGWFEDYTRNESATSETQQGFSNALSASGYEYRLSLPASLQETEYKSVLQKDAEPSKAAAEDVAPAYDTKEQTVGAGIGAPVVRYATHASDAYCRRRKLRRAVLEAKDVKQASRGGASVTVSADTVQYAPPSAPTTTEQSPGLPSNDHSQLLPTASVRVDHDRDHETHALNSINDAIAELRGFAGSKPGIRPIASEEPANSIKRVRHHGRKTKNVGTEWTHQP